MATRRTRSVIVASRFNEMVVERLVSGAKERWIELGVAPSSIEVIWVPGAMELPLAAKHAIRTRKPRFVCAVGAVIRGETPHFDLVSQAAAQGLMTVMLETGTPIGFGVLSTNDMNQALARAGGEVGNAGAQAAETVWEMTKWMKRS